MLNVSTPASKTERSGIAWFRLGVWKLKGCEGRREGQMCGERKEETIHC